MQALAIEEPTVSEGTLRTFEGRALPLEHTAVQARIVGPVASVEVVQRFRNDTGGAIEAVYLFPLPHEASVHRMSFRIGARVVQAVVKEREEAKRAYQAARSEGRSATLLEQERPNLFTLSVANIPAGETIEVTLGYQERLAYDEGEWRLVFPLCAAERYSPGVPSGAAGKDGAVPTAEVPDAARIRPPRLRARERGSDVSIEAEIRAGRAIDPPRSPSHAILSEQLAEDAYRVRLSPGDVIPNRDFVLAYRVAREGVRTEVLFERRPDATGSFLLVLTPSVSPLPDAEDESPESRAAVEGRSFRCGNCGAALADPGAVRDFPLIGPGFCCEFCGTVVSTRELKARVALPRDVIFLVDRSASMRGGSLAQARRAVIGILERLGKRDAVQLFAFDHERLALDGRGESFLESSAGTRQRVAGFLEGLKPRGGSELEEALGRAAKLEARTGRARLVVLLTDAAVGNEGRLLRRVPAILGKETRLYVLGVGPAVNRYLVERLARAGGGASDVLLPGEDPALCVERFARRVRQAGPVLSGLKLSWDEALAVDVYPSPVPDLFGGQTVQLLGRFAGVGASRLVLTGTLADGEPFRQEIDVVLPESSAECPGLERLWARLRIDSRLERLARAPEELSEIRLEVLGLALKHSLLSPYTALVAEDSEKRVDGPARRIEVPVAEPEPRMQTRAGILRPSPGPRGAPLPPPAGAPMPAMAMALPAMLSAPPTPALARARRSMSAGAGFLEDTARSPGSMELEADEPADLSEHAATRSGFAPTAGRLGRYAVRGTAADGSLEVEVMGAAGFEKRLSATRVEREIDEDAELRELFIEEAKRAAALSHPGIAQIFDIGEDDEGLYYASELCDGARASTCSALAAGAAVAVVGEVLRSLEHAHAKGVVHGELGPETVVTGVGLAGSVRLLGFGLGRARRALALRRGSLPRQAGCLAPELLAGEPGDARSDLYGAGALLHRLLTGKPLRETSSTAEHLRLAKAAATPRIEGALGEVLGRALAPRPEDRYPTAAEMIAALEGAGFPIPKLPAPTPSLAPSSPPPPPAAMARPGLGSRIMRFFGVGGSDDAGSGGPPLQIPGSEPYSEEELAYVAQKAVGELDLVFLVDETGSMGPYIEEVKRRLLAIIEALRAAPLCRSLRLGLVSYRDHPPQDTSFVSRVVPLTEDVRAIHEGVSRMQASGGGDGPEAVTDGLYDLVRLDWRPAAARVVVWVGDAPPHGIGSEGDGFPDGCPCGHHWFTQAESCREMGVVVHAVGCLPTLHAFPDAEEVYQTVARATRGLYLPLSAAPLLIPLIAGVAESELDKQRIQERIAEALARYQRELAPAEDQERVRYLTEVLRAENLRPRGLAAGSGGSAPLRFRGLTEADVEEGLDRLRRLGRSSI